MTRVIRASIIAVIIILSVTAGLFYYMRYAGITENVMKAVPEDAIMIFKVKNADSVAAAILKSTLPESFNSFEAIFKFRDGLIKFDSFYRSDASFSELIAKKELTISMHNVSEGRFDLL